MSLADVNLTLVQSLDDLLDLREWLGKRREWLGLDIETEGLNVGRDKVRLVQVGDALRGWAVPYDEYRGAIREFIRSYRGNVVAHNLLFEQKFLAREGMPIPQRWAHDTMVMAFLHDSWSRLDLKGLATMHVDKMAAALGQGQLEEAFSAGGWDWSTIPVDHPSYWIYSALDPVLTARLAEKLWPTASRYREAYEIELGAIHCIRTAEMKGMKIDLDYSERARAKLLAEMASVEPSIPFRAGSDQQAVAYFKQAGATCLKRTDTGNWSLDEEVLVYYRDVLGMPLAGDLLRYRKARKLVSSYFNKFDELHVDGRLHCSTRPLGAKTSRMSITDPALQTLPRGRIVRDAFIAAPGHSLISADYEQMELRVFAHYAQEQAMLAAIREGQDLHNFTAGAVYGNDFTREQRQTAKNAGFAKIYGAGAAKFAVTAKITLQEAEGFLARYDELFPGARVFQEQVIRSIQQRSETNHRMGWVELVDGRRIMCPGDEAYKGVNYLIQGGCATVTKRKIVELDHAGLGEFFRLPIHDELILEVPDDQLAEVLQVVNSVMPEVNLFDCPLAAEGEVIKRWGDKYPDKEPFVELEAAS